MRQRLTTVCFIFLTALVLLAGRASGETRQDETSLRKLSQLSLEEWQQVESGDIVVKTVGDHEEREVTLIVMARVRASASCYVERFQNIERFKKSPEVLRVGKLVTPLSADLNGFSLEPADLVALRECRPGNCGVKLSLNSIRLLRGKVDWGAPDAIATARSLLQAEFFKYLDSYLDTGNLELMAYADKGAVAPMGKAFRSLLDASPGVRDFSPEFYEYLADYPSRPLNGVTDFLYWSRENFGVKPVTSITHAVIYPSPGRALIASKQVYASHYFEASLGLTLVVDRNGNASAPESYLLYLNRSKIDLLGGFLGGFRRALLRPHLREGAKKHLAALAQRLESDCATFSPQANRSPGK